MSVVQTEYPNYHDALIEGQIHNTQTCDIDSLIARGSDDIPFGRAVRNSAVTGAGAKDVDLGIATNLFRGISVQDQRLPATNGAVYKQGNVVSVLWRGDIVVKVHAAVAAGANVVAATVATTGASPEAKGQLSTTVADTTHILIPGARFMTAAVAGGLAVVRLAGPVPAA